MIARLFLMACWPALVMSSSAVAATIVSITRLDVDQTLSYTEAIVPSLQGAPPLYQDYSFVFYFHPSYLTGAEYVRMVNQDALDPDYQLQLTLSQPATIYLLVDDRSTTATLPWVAARGFQDTGDDAMVFNLPYSVYVTTAPAGTFTLAQNSGSSNMYSVFVVPEPSSLLAFVAAASISLGLRRHRRAAHC